MSLLPVLLGITLIVFFMIRLIPGDPAATLLGVRATDESVRALHTPLGLDQPVLEAVPDFLGQLLQGDLGYSYFYNTDVTRAGHGQPAGDDLAAGRRRPSSPC